jgi:hypothetical protein
MREQIAPEASNALVSRRQVMIGAAGLSFASPPFRHRKRRHSRCRHNGKP